MSFARHLYTLLQGALGLEDRRGELRYVGGLMLGLGLEGFGIYLEDFLLVMTFLSLEEVATFWRP